MGADGSEELRMAESEMERAEASHGDAVDGAISAAGGGAVALFDEGKKFLDEEIFVAVLAVLGIDVEACAAVGRGDQKIFQFVLLAEIADYVPEAGVDEELLVVAEAVEEIEDGEVAGFVHVEIRGKNDAIGDGAGENFTGERVAFYAAGGGVGGDAQ